MRQQEQLVVWGRQLPPGAADLEVVEKRHQLGRLRQESLQGLGCTFRSGGLIRVLPRGGVEVVDSILERIS